MKTPPVFVCRECGKEQENPHPGFNCIGEGYVGLPPGCAGPEQTDWEYMCKDCHRNIVGDNPVMDYATRTTAI